MKIVIDDKIPFVEGALETVADVEYIPGKRIVREDLLDADAMIIRTRTRCNESLLKGTSVKFIATATIGHDHIDADYCSRAGITWTSAPGCNSSSVEQYIVSALLHLAHSNGFEPKDMVLGVAGVGNVGMKVESAARALGMKVLLCDPPRERREGAEQFTSLNDLLDGSDIVTLHVPLSDSGADKTLGMADRKFFNRMKRGSFFINTSRGEVVDENALKASLASEHISGALLDVYVNEPDVDQELLKRLTLATPHIAGYSVDGKANGTRMSVRSVNSFFQLGLDSWEPSGIPAPRDPDIYLDGSEGNETEMLYTAYGRTYNILADHDRFMAQPGAFEGLRGSYPVRREPGAYNIKLFSDDGKYRDLFETLGFNVLGDSCY
ncbi:MAG: 4-phosphoerythronate dehydrogenase [Bacteroidales bacterium]|nr:4-phosphoerythronate dehydrogenase [Bacteroidales bacterium]